MNGPDDKPLAALTPLGMAPLGMAPLDCPPDPSLDDAPC